MYTVMPLNTKNDAARIVDFFFSKDAFEHIWAPGEKDIVKNAVFKSLEDGKNHRYWFVEDKEMVIGAIGINENSYKSGDTKWLRIMSPSTGCTGKKGSGHSSFTC